MKKQIATLAAMMALAIGSAQAVEVPGQTGELKMIGNILSSTCVVDQNELDHTVNFGSIPIEDVQTAANKATLSSQKFEIHATGCDATVTGVSVKVNFTQVYSANNVKNSGTATGVVMSLQQLGLC